MRPFESAAIAVTVLMLACAKQEDGTDLSLHDPSSSTAGVSGGGSSTRGVGAGGAMLPIGGNDNTEAGGGARATAGTSSATGGSSASAGGPAEPGGGGMATGAGGVFTQPGGSAGTAGVAATGSNLVLNPGFEFGTFSSWDSWDNALSVITTPVHSGGFAGKVVHADPGGGSGQIINVETGATYVLSGWGELQGGASFGAMGYHLLTDKNEAVGDVVYLNGFTNSFEQRTTMVTIAAPASRLQIALWYNPNMNPGAALVVDDFSLTKQ